MAARFVDESDDLGLAWSSADQVLPDDGWMILRHGFVGEPYGDDDFYAAAFVKGDILRAYAEDPVMALKFLRLMILEKLGDATS